MHNRRRFLVGAGSLAVLAAGRNRALASPAIPQTHDFDFLFLTDTHIEPELNAAAGCSMAFKQARTNKVDFAIQGGDHVFDSMKVTKERATGLFDLYARTEQDLGMKLWHTCGNHDCFAIAKGDPSQQSDPLYGKKMFADHFGPVHYSFDHKGTHFIVLDSVQPKTDASGYVGGIDEEQLKWLRDDLAKTGATTPTIVTTHIPLVSAIDNYQKLADGKAGGKGGSTIGNSEQVWPLFRRHNVIGVLQGHTHIWETVLWEGIPYVTGGAVSGNWWKGTHLGTPEGYTIVSVRNGKMNVRYETYGFQTVRPENT